jgi:DNA-binding NtrC family response regulator
MTSYSNAKVLVVDDEEVVRASYLRSLASKHCQVRTANNGMDALQLMAQQSFDVVLLDQRMPGMDGMAVLRSIKSQWPDTEVIMVTGYPALDCAKEAVMLGAYDYLSKPIGPDEVLQAAHGAMTCKRWGLHKVNTTTPGGVTHMHSMRGEAK